MRLVIALLLVAVLAACGGEKRPLPRSAQAYNSFAVMFAEALNRRDYAGAHAMLTPAHAAKVSAAQLKSDFEALVPSNVTGLRAEAIGEPLTEWPDQALNDTAIIYVTIEGAGLEEFEAITLTLGEEAGQQKVSAIEYGRSD